MIFEDNIRETRRNLGRAGEKVVITGGNVQTLAQIEVTQTACYYSYMALYLARTCPKCRGYLGIAIQHDDPEARVRAIEAQCASCGYKIAWKVIQGRRDS